MKKLIGLVAAAVMAATGFAHADDWPSKPIKLIVPFKAGGTSDQVGRMLQAGAEETKALSQPITIVNVGGHYSIGSRRVMEADPDGYSFLLIHIALMGGEGTGALDFGWRDFKPVIATGEFCVLPMVRKDSGIDTVADLKGKRFPIGWQGFQQGIPLSNAMLATAGLSLDDMDGVPTANLLRAADDFKAGRLDATIFAIGAPKMAEVDAAVGIKFLDLPDTPEAAKTLQM